MHDQKGLHSARRVATKHVTSGGAYFHGLAPVPVQHSSEETSQWWRAVGDNVPDLTVPGVEPPTYRTDSNVLKN